MDLRLLLWEECNRTCEGCCNKDFDLPNLPVLNPEDALHYDLIMLTGGEPMLNPSTVTRTADHLRKYTDAKIVMYTAATYDSLRLPVVCTHLDGVTVTVHEPSDVNDLYLLDEALCIWQDDYPQDFSARLNIFAGCEVDRTRLNFGWYIKDNIEWIKDCPLPENEDFKRLSPYRSAA